MTFSVISQLYSYSNPVKKIFVLFRVALSSKIYFPFHLSNFVLSSQNSSFSNQPTKTPLKNHSFNFQSWSSVRSILFVINLSSFLQPFDKIFVFVSFQNLKR